MGSRVGGGSPNDLLDGDTGMQSFAVYIIECSDGSFYTGYTNDPERRLKEHNGGYGSKYTAARTPVTLIHLESYHTQSAAMSREHEIKQFTRAEKEELVGFGEES